MALYTQAGAVGVPTTSTRSAFLPGQVQPSSRGALFGESLRVNSRQTARPQAAKRRLTVRGLFGLGVPELAVIAGVAALVFGPKKLPELGKSLGKTVKSFQQAASEFQSELTTTRGEAQEDENADLSPPAEKEKSEA